MRERGLKQLGGIKPKVERMSLPVRERGLKPYAAPNRSTSGRSLPVRERGLKHMPAWLDLTRPDVAPRAGAWIETSLPLINRLESLSLPVRERGLKHAGI